MNATLEASAQSSETQEVEIKVCHLVERRAHRRHEMDRREICVERWDGNRRDTREFGRLMDLSAGGLRIRTSDANVKVDQQIRVRLELPDYAGISPFVDASGAELQAKREWIGWMSVNRIDSIDGREVEVAGRLVDMQDLDRGMLALYLSTQPVAV
jgi:hypothetical protein